MPEIKERDGVVFLEGDKFDMKIDKARKIYVKAKNKSTHNYIGHDVPEGMSLIEKKRVIYELYRKIESRLSEE